MEQLRKDIKEVAGRAERKADTIEVQHLLVAHAGAGIGGVTRSMDEAEKLAAELYAQIKGGADFDALVKEHTDDAHPGIYGMTMSGSGDRGKNIYPRKGMVAAFGDVGWRLDVGEVGVAPYHDRNSPYGWHIIKRTK
ncbi:MAG: peptidylprolyl isomerase [Planctomycetes bacterium]|nr:peptidylprolyl isomerase [Planctomycetota bacterium]